MLAEERYVRLTTFRRDGTPVATPVWVVGLPDGRLGVQTGSQSGKVRRLAHTPRATLQPCDARGRVLTGSMPAQADAEIVTGPLYDEIRVAVRLKYGSATTLARAVQSVAGIVKRKRSPHGDVGVVLTVSAAEGT